jgi:hippurate hydrolase
VNHPQEARFMARVMEMVVGTDNVHRDVQPAMTAEDFGFMLEKVPGAYGFIGNGARGQPGINLHSPAYDFNDDILGLGATFWDRLARQWFDDEDTKRREMHS